MHLWILWPELSCFSSLIASYCRIEDTFLHILASHNFAFFQAPIKTQMYIVFGERSLTCWYVKFSLLFIQDRHLPKLETKKTWANGVPESVGGYFTHDTQLRTKFLNDFWVSLSVGGGKQATCISGRPLSDRSQISFRVGVMSPHISTGIQRKAFILWFYELRSLAESVASRAAGYTILQVSLMLSVDSKAEVKAPKGWLNMGEHGWTKRIVQVTTELLDILLHQSFGHPLVYQCLPEVPDEFIIRSKHICGVLTMAIHFDSILKFLCFNDDHWRVLPPEFDWERLNGCGHFPVFSGNCLVIRCKFFEVTLPHLSIASWHAHDSDMQLVGSCPCYGRLAWCDLHLEIVHVVT